MNKYEFKLGYQIYKFKEEVSYDGKNSTLEEYYTTQEFCDEYSALADYCNNHGYIIEDKGDYYECVTITPPPEPSAKEKLEQEMYQLEAYLKNTDYMAIKCGERGLSMANEYPNEFYRRQACRDRINEIREALKRY